MLVMLGSVIAMVAGVACLIYGIKLLILAFQESVLWGLGSLFVPFVSLIFIIMHWERCKSPFLRYLAAAFVSGFGVVIAAVGGASA